jgi:hypothetical protein
LRWLHIAWIECITFEESWFTRLSPATRDRSKLDARLDVACVVLAGPDMRVQTILASVCALLAAACSSSPTDKVTTSRAAVGGFSGCSGVFNTNASPTGEYYATDFGCSSDPPFTDPGDTCGSAACIESAYDEGVCTSSQSHADCQREVNWYSVGGASYGCGARLQVSNPANGKSVVVMVLDNGPSCTVENEADFWVLDVSYPTIEYLFGEEEGYSDHALIDAVVVDSSTPLGPTSGSSTPPPSPSADASSPPGDGGPSADGGSSGDEASHGGTACNTDGDCNPGSDGSGQICVDGTCVAGCDADWECPGDTTCIDGQCK